MYLITFRICCHFASAAVDFTLRVIPLIGQKGPLKNSFYRNVSISESSLSRRDKTKSQRVDKCRCTSMSLPHND